MLTFYLQMHKTLRKIKNTDIFEKLFLRNSGFKSDKVNVITEHTENCRYFNEACNLNG